MITHKTKRKTVLVLLIMLSFVCTTGTFAYWASSVEGTNQEALSTLVVGAGDVVETKATVSPNQQSTLGTLVPLGHKDNSISDATEAIQFYYELLWQEHQSMSQVLGEQIQGNVEIVIDYTIYLNNSNIILDKEFYPQIYELVHISIDDNSQYSIVLNDNKPNDYLFTVTIDEPRNQEEYNLISRSTIEFTYMFYVNEKQYDFNYNFVDMSYEELLDTNAISTNFDDWYTEEGLPLSDVKPWSERTIFFPVSDDEYTVTITASLNNIDSIRNGYGIFFDTTFDELVSDDNGYVFQFDRGFSSGEMIVRERISGTEMNPLFRESSDDENIFPSKYDDPSWWIDTHEIRISVKNIDSQTREATFYIDGIEIGTIQYEKVETIEQNYVGFRVWGGDNTNFYSIEVE